MGRRRETTEIQTGWQYFGNFVILLASRPVRRLHKIQIGDEVLWDGTIDSDSADGAGKTDIDTTRGVLRFYWGHQTTPDILLAAAHESVSAYPDWCFCVAVDFDWGSDRPNPPHILFDLEVATDDLDISEHDDEGDVSPAEGLWHFLRDGAEGPGFAEAGLNKASFEGAAEALITEGIWCSPEIDERHTLRDILGRFLEVARGWLVEDEEGRVALRLDRPEAVAATITADELIEEPDFPPSQAGEVFSSTFVEFRDRERRDEEPPEGYIDHALIAERGRDNAQTVTMHWLRRRIVARRIAAREGFIATRERPTGRLWVLPSVAVRAGDRVFLDYPKAGLAMRLVVTETERFADRVGLRVVKDVAVDPATITVPDPPDLDAIPEEVNWDNAILRSAALPQPFLGDRRDGYIVVSNRPHSFVDLVRYFAGRHGTETEFATTYATPSGFLSPYFPDRSDLRGSGGSEFAAAVTAVWRKHPVIDELEDPDEADNVILRVQARTPSDITLLSTMALRATQGDTIYLMGQLVSGSSNQRIRVLRVFEAELVGVGLWSFFARHVPGAHGSADGNVRDLCFVGPAAAFWRVRSTSALSWLSGSRVYQAGLMARAVRAEYRSAFGNHTVHHGDTWHFDDQQPVPAWGDDPVPLVYELYNAEAGKEVDTNDGDFAAIAGVDEALGALFGGSTEPADLFWSDVDEALGLFFESGFYE